MSTFWLVLDPCARQYYMLSWRPNQKSCTHILCPWRCHGVEQLTNLSRSWCLLNVVFNDSLPPPREWEMGDGVTIFTFPGAWKPHLWIFTGANNEKETRTKLMITLVGATWQYLCVAVKGHWKHQRWRQGAVSVIKIQKYIYRSHYRSVELVGACDSVKLLGMFFLAKWNRTLAISSWEIPASGPGQWMFIASVGYIPTRNL